MKFTYYFRLWDVTEGASCGEGVNVTVRSDPAGPAGIADKKTIGKGIMEGVLN